MPGEYPLDSSSLSPATRKANRKHYGRKTVIKDDYQAVNYSKAVSAPVTTAPLVEGWQTALQQPYLWFDTVGAKTFSVLTNLYASANFAIGYDINKCILLRSEVVRNRVGDYNYRPLSGKHYNNGRFEEYTEAEKVFHKETYDRSYIQRSVELNGIILKFIEEYTRLSNCIIAAKDNFTVIQYNTQYEEWFRMHTVSQEAARKAFREVII